MIELVGLIMSCFLTSSTTQCFAAGIILGVGCVPLSAVWYTHKLRDASPAPVDKRVRLTKPHAKNRLVHVLPDAHEMMNEAAPGKLSFF